MARFARGTRTARVLHIRRVKLPRRPDGVGRADLARHRREQSGGGGYLTLADRLRHPWCTELRPGSFMHREGYPAYVSGFE